MHATPSMLASHGLHLTLIHHGTFAYSTNASCLTQLYPQVRQELRELVEEPILYVATPLEVIFDPVNSTDHKAGQTAQALMRMRDAAALQHDNTYIHNLLVCPTSAIYAAWLWCTCHMSLQAYQAFQATCPALGAGWQDNFEGPHNLNLQMGAVVPFPGQRPKRCASCCTVANGLHSCSTHAEDLTHLHALHRRVIPEWPRQPPSGPAPPT